MKSFAISILLVLPMVLSAQISTTIICDNFDTLLTGSSLVSQSSLWETWNGGVNNNEDPILTSAQYNTVPNSVYVISNGATTGPIDFVLPFPQTYSTGRYELSMRMYITNGNGGYFNCGGGWKSGGVDYDYGSEIFFNTDGSGQVIRGGASQFVFSYNWDYWMEILVIIDLGGSVFQLYIDDDSIGTHGYDANFGVIDIFSVAYTDTSNQANGIAEFYVDDVCLKEIMDDPTSISDLANTSNLTITPGINTGQFRIAMSDYFGETEIQIYDLGGNLIISESINDRIHDFNLDLAPGMYILLAKENDGVVSRKFVVE